MDSRRRVVTQLRGLKLLCCVCTIILLSSFTSSYVQAEIVNIAWDAPTTNEDGTPLLDLGGYEVHYGPTSGNYTDVVDIGNFTTASLDLTQTGTYFIAVLAYDTAPSRNLSQYSNEISVTVNGNSSITVVPMLEVGSADGMQFDVDMFDSGGNNLYSTTVTADSTGVLTIPIPAGLPSTVTLRLKTLGYLAKAVPGWVLASNTTFPALLAGDLDDNNIVNSGDWSLMNSMWFQGDDNPDLNDDGIVNSADLLYLISNWFVHGD